jgi:hypothetical protein
MQHDWIKSTLGHGETMCSSCFITNREAAALGKTNECDVPPTVPKAANENIPNYDDEDRGYEQPMVCPVTCQPCTTEQDEFCEDYGCARKAGIDVDRDLIL